MKKIQNKVGYLYRVFQEIGWEEIRLLQKCKEKCEKLIVGIPSDSLFVELMKKKPEKVFADMREILMMLKSVDEVVPIDYDNISVQDSFREIGYDCLFYGSEYGEQYIKDKQFLEEKNVRQVSLIPEKFETPEEDGILQRVLRSRFIEGKIILFGTGDYFEYYMQTYGKKFPPAYAVDNLKEKWNTKKSNVIIRNPNELYNERPEDVFIILCCKEYKDIKKQILSIGAFEYRTLRQAYNISILEEYASILKKKKKFKKGYILGNFEDAGIEEGYLQGCKDCCEMLVFGIPADELVLRMTDKLPEKGFTEKKEHILQLQLADEIVEVNTDNINVMESYYQIGYDVYFYGTEYGKKYEVDREFLFEKGVSMILLSSENRKGGEGEDSLWKALNNATADRKVILFGTGKYFDYYIERYGEEFPPAYSVDNDEKKWNTKKSGILIQNPETLREEQINNVFVVLCCKNYCEMRKQLLAIGDFDYRTLLQNSDLAILEEYAVILQEEKEYMEKAHSILKKLMIEFDAVCKQYGLKYFLMGGSLIGAVRHKGLIPWDDDIDVAMFRNDYEILRENAKEIWTEKADFLFLDYDQLGGNTFYDFLTRIVYMKEELPTRLFKKVEGKARPDIQNKLVMDIYVMENADNNEKIHRSVTMLMKGVYALAIGHRAIVDYSEYKFLPKSTFNCVKIAINIGRFIPLKWLFYFFERLRGYARRKDCDYVFESNNGAINYMPWRYDKKIYGEGKTLPVCGYDVMVPDDCDGLLKAKGYGDYMSLPPVNCRKPSHSIKAKGIIW